MLTLHDDIELTCGDEWQIAGTLLQEDGNPLNLNPDVQIGWVLLDPDGFPVPGVNTLGSLERLEPVTGGQVLITLPEELTSLFRPGRFTDALRVRVGSTRSLLWRGLILANADPFALEVT